MSGRPAQQPLGSFGERVRRLIDQSDRVKNRADFLRKAEIDGAQFYRYELGPEGEDSRSPSIDQVKAWASLLGCSVSDLAGEETTVERPTAYPALRDFLATVEGKTVTPAERVQLEAQRWKNPPSGLSYHFLLQAIRSGASPEASSAGAEITAGAHARAIARGGKPLQKSKR